MAVIYYNVGGVLALSGGQAIYTGLVSPTPTNSITPTRTPSITPTITPSISITPTRTPSITPTITPSISITPTRTPSITPTITPSISITPTRTPSITPTRTITPSASKAVIPLIAVGIANVIAVKNNNNWSWGDNNVGELGNFSVVYRCTPVSILGAKKTFCRIAAGQTHVSAIDNKGQIWNWGESIYGELAYNTGLQIYKCTPVSILGAKKTFCQITNALYVTNAIDKNGQVWGWGYNAYGQLGTNALTCASTPISVLGGKKTFCQITGGNHYTLGIDKNGLLWGWGYNAKGQIAIYSNVSKRTPVSILGGKKTFCQITGGGYHAHGIDKNGQVWGWGYNTNGQIGNNSVIAAISTPVSVLGTKKTFCDISDGGKFSIGIDKNGQVWGWGYNSKGQLGTNSTVSQRTPVSILGTKKTFCYISVGENSEITIAIDKGGLLWGWGDNAQGQLGDGTVVGRLTPVRVCTL